MKINVPFLNCKLNDIASNTCNTSNRIEILNTTSSASQTTLESILATLQTSQDYEAKFVTDAEGTRLLEVRVYNTDDSTWEAPIYFAPGSAVPVVPVDPVIYEGTTTRSVLTIPTVAAAPITNWDASIAFTSDILSFQDRNKIFPWAFQITDYNIAVGLPTITLEVSLNGVDFTNYKTASTLIDMTDTDNNAFNFDDISAFEYARFDYVPNGATGSFSLIVSK